MKMCSAPICCVHQPFHGDLYPSTHMQLISRGASGRHEYVLELFISINMMKSPLSSKEWLIDIGSFYIVLTSCTIRYLIRVGKTTSSKSNVVQDNI